MPDPITFNGSNVGGWRVIAAMGEQVEIEHQDGSPALKLAIAAEIEKGHIYLVIDLSRVTFVDSTAFGVLIGAYKWLGKRSGQFRLVVINEDVLKNFNITGLDKIFEIFSTVRDATAQFPSGGAG